MRKKTTEEFIKESKNINGEKYDYSKTVYKDIKTKVCITCPEHGDFYLIPDNHIRKRYGCPECGNIKKGESNSLTWPEFLLRARGVHGYKYDYSKAQELYKNSESILTIICKEHGEFTQTAKGHLNGGCLKCGFNKLSKDRRDTKELFIKKAIRVHSNNYDYSNTEYVNSTTPVKIRCLKHGEFTQTPNVHLMGCGCQKCKHEKLLELANSRKIGIEKFILSASELHNNKYDYSLSKYVNNKIPLKILCPIHGEFWQKPSNHLHGKGCPLCANESISKKLTKPKEQFIKEAVNINGYIYDYSKVIYVDSWTPVEIICKKHGSFYQKPAHHIYQGAGCPKCTLKSQTKVFEKLCESFPNENILFEVGRKTLKWIGSLRLDIYFPDYNIAIEYDGKQHFVPIDHFGGEIAFENRKKLDKLKESLCKKNGCVLFRIPYNYTDNELLELTNSIANIIKKVR